MWGDGRGKSISIMLKAFNSSVKDAPLINFMKL